jgi:hypothetical protein
LVLLNDPNNDQKKSCKITWTYIIW